MYEDRFDFKKYEDNERVAVGYGIPDAPEKW